MCAKGRTPDIMMSALYISRLPGGFIPIITGSCYLLVRVDKEYPATHPSVTHRLKQRLEPIPSRSLPLCAVLHLFSPIECQHTAPCRFFFCNIMKDRHGLAVRRSLKRDACPSFSPSSRCKSIDAVLLTLMRCLSLEATSPHLLLSSG